jgi:hypothetical protein
MSSTLLKTSATVALLLGLNASLPPNAADTALSECPDLLRPESRGRSACRLGQALGWRRRLCTDLAGAVTNATSADDRAWRCAYANHHRKLAGPGLFRPGTENAARLQSRWSQECDKVGRRQFAGAIGLRESDIPTGHQAPPSPGSQAFARQEPDIF